MHNLSQALIPLTNVGQFYFRIQFYVKDSGTALMPGCLSAKEAIVSTSFKLFRLAVSDDRMEDWTRTMSPLFGNLSFPFLKVFASSPTGFSSSEEEEGGKEEEEEEECLDFFDFFFLCLEDMTFFLLYISPCETPEPESE
jgi:hypothetical protein